MHSTQVPSWEKKFAWGFVTKCPVLPTIRIKLTHLGNSKKVKSKPRELKEPFKMYVAIRKEKCKWLQWTAGMKKRCCLTGKGAMLNNHEGDFSTFIDNCNWQLLNNHHHVLSILINTAANHQRLALRDNMQWKENTMLSFTVCKEYCEHHMANTQVWSLANMTLRLTYARPGELLELRALRTVQCQKKMAACSAGSIVPALAVTKRTPLANLTSMNDSLVPYRGT